MKRACTLSLLWLALGAGGPVPGHAAVLTPPAVRQALAGACAEDLPPGRPGAREANLGHGDRLWLMPCAAGAYATQYAAVFQAHDGAAYRLYFSTWIRDGLVAQGTIADPVFHPDTGRLTSSEKLIGIGTCRRQASFQWNGHLFVLRELRANEDCRRAAKVLPLRYADPASTAS